MTPEQAIEIVARRVISDAFESETWEDYPDIGEGDWERVLVRAKALAPMPESVKFDEAYRLLAARADTEA